MPSAAAPLRTACARDGGSTRGTTARQRKNGGDARLQRIRAPNTSSSSSSRAQLCLHSSSITEYQHEQHDTTVHVQDSSTRQAPLTRGEFGRIALGTAGAASVFALGGGAGGLPRSAFAEGTEAGDVAAAATAAPAEEPPPAVATEGGGSLVALRDMGLEVPYTGKSLPLSKFLGSKATLVVNPKIDDPESLHQVRFVASTDCCIVRCDLRYLLYCSCVGFVDAHTDVVKMLPRIYVCLLSVAQEPLLVDG